LFALIVEHPIIDPAMRIVILAIEAMLFLYFIVSNALYLWTVLAVV
jgi:hypothetical protein